jgi:hypothetical protein
VAQARFSPTPVGTQQRIRTRAIWAVALFAASVLPALVGLGVAHMAVDQDNVALPLAALFWAIGLLFALWAAIPTVRYWDVLPGYVRWLGALPMLTVSAFLSVALIATVLA